MHPMVKPALRRSWRERESLQIGVDPAHAVRLDGVDRTTAEFLDLLDGTRGLDLVRSEAAALGLPQRRVDRLLGLLAEGGVLDDAESAGELGGLAESARERLRPDLSSLSVVHRGPGVAAARMAARGGQTVLVHGAGRVGATLAAVLAAAGVGWVNVVDAGRTEPWDLAPGGAAAADLGRQRAAAASAAVRRAVPDSGVPAPAGRVGALHPGSDANLVLVARRDGLSAFAPDPAEAEPWMHAGLPHLYAGVAEATGIVGPLVLPGQSACARCLALHRADTDPAWPRMLAQLRSGRAVPVPPCDTALAITVAGLAAVHALMFLDGGRPASLGGRLEVSLTDTSMTAHPISPHPECGCTWQPGGREGAA